MKRSAVLTRRSLLRTAALAPLIIPARGLAWPLGGAPAVITNPCTQITAISQINVNGPGCYQLIANDPAGFVVLQAHDNVTLDGNGFTLLGTLQIGISDGSRVGLFVHNLNCQQINAYGSASTAQMATPAVHLKDMTVTRGPPSGPATLPGSFYGSNILVENLMIDGSSDPSTGTDDPAVLYNLDVAHPVSTWCSFINCRFGPNFDVGIEGVGNWNHVTITGCSGMNGNAWADIAAWYGPDFPSSHATNFTFNNCTITNNTMRASKGMIFTDGSFLQHAFSDAEATTQWGATPSMPGGGANNFFQGNLYI